MIGAVILAGMQKICQKETLTPLLLPMAELPFEQIICPAFAMNKYRPI
jgi:hypothetical protein